MTLTDVIIRDLEIARREQERRNISRSLAEYDREINRRIWRRRLKAVGEMLAGAAVLALTFALAWLSMACSGYHWE